MVHLIELVIFLIFLSFSNCSLDQLRPRGVPLSKSSLYNPTTDFTCLDGSLTVPFSHVNDDYCDCPDGSDEPGTSACPEGVFHCTNLGYTPSNIPTSWINDGVCDCCDASDEYMTDNCSDVCAILGAEAKRKAEKLAELTIQGNQLRLEMSSSGKQILQEKQQRISQLELEKAEAERLRNEAEVVKNSAEANESAALQVYRDQEEAERKEKLEKEKLEEEKEAFEVFRQLDSNGDNVLQVNEITPRQTFDQNKDGKVSEDELKFFIGDKISVAWDEFKDTVWPRLKPFYMMDKGLFSPPVTENVEEGQEEGKEEDHDYNDHEDPDNENLPEGERDEDWENNEEQEEHAKEPEEEGPKETKYDEATQKLIDDANQARGTYESANRAVQDLERELSSLRESISKDYGLDQEFAPLDGQCFSYSDREYTYKLCPFDQVSQSPRSGGSETRLGQWKGWESTENYNVMLYDRGQSCWNGPQRSTKVMVSCGLENVVVGSAEPNKCEYVLDFKTPAACRLHQTRDTHDEL